MKPKELVLIILLVLALYLPAHAASEAFQDSIYPVGKLKPIDSIPKLKVGDKAPDFELPAVAGGTLKLSGYRGKKNVVISFIPAAWTPVCSDQWPGYNIVEDIFTANNAILLGISVDNIPTLFAWTGRMGKLWFPVLSDFWPHGAVADKYGVLRTGGTSERAIFIIDTRGIIRYIDIHDINQRPPLDGIVKALQDIQ
jgi:peroxiredoxin